jgi:hypothetical protein
MLNVHVSERCVRRIERGQAFKEEAVRLRIGPEIVVDQPERGADQADRLRVEKQVSPLGLDEKADQVDRIFLEDAGLLDVQAVVVELEIGRGGEVGVGRGGGLGAVAPGQGAQKIAKRRHGLELPQFEARNHNAGQVAHVLGDQEVVLHEPLDAQKPEPVMIAQEACHLGLQIEGEALLRLARQEMEIAADRPEEGFAAVEDRRLVG